MIPHEEIRAKHDRSWTFRLVDAIRSSCSYEDLSEICETLQELEDPRAVKPLLQMLEDLSQPFNVRKAASEVLQFSCIGLCDDDRHGWWSSEDSLLRRHAVLEARTSEAHFLIPIASDPEHEFHEEAIRSLQYGFEEPEYQRLSINALSHKNPRVRRAAARNLIWEEPFEAQGGLIRALSDPVEDVANEALTTISYFSSQQILRALSELSKLVSGEKREDLDGVLCRHEYQFEDALSRLSGESHDFFRTWLKPVEDLLDFSEREESDSALPLSPNTTEQKFDSLLGSTSDIIDLFSDTDLYWHDMYLHFMRFDWASLAETERVALVEFFREHHDPHIREMACKPLSAWNRVDVLETFLRDRCTSVRKYAAIGLQSVAPDPSLAASLWSEYRSVNCTGIRSAATLLAFVVHAPRAGLEDLLVEIAITDRRASRKSAAIEQLVALEANSHMQSVLSLLGEPPLLNWAIHAQLVDYCAEQRISTPFFADLCQVDDLNLQRSLAQAVPFLQPVILKGVKYAAKN